MYIWNVIRTTALRRINDYGNSALDHSANQDRVMGWKGGLYAGRGRYEQPPDKPPFRRFHYR